MEQDLRKLLRNFIIELLVYAVLVTAYFFGVLRLLGEPLEQMYRDNPELYAVTGLLLILIQGVALEYVTSFLVRFLGLERLE